jgi:hypothetical protein
MDIKTLLVETLIAVDNARPRSQQTAVGVSSLGGCRREVWHQLQGDTGTARGTRLPAIMGTAIHSAIEQALAGQDRFLLEHRVELDGLPPATIDCYDTVNNEVIDWKTTKKSNLDYFPSQQQRWQVQVYGYLMTQSGYEVRNVTLVAIPRDGNENDIKVHTEPYDRSVAIDALNWLNEITATKSAPAPEKDAASWCSKFCDFYGDLCGGKTKDVTGEAITDERAEKAAKRYVEVSAQIKALEAEKEASKAALEGVSGVTLDGIKVTWAETKGRETVDLDAVKFLLPDVPMKTGAPSLRLTVK